MDYSISFKTKLRVRYGETDQMGYCYYGNYAEYFEVGRVEFLREIGMSYKKFEEQGFLLPVSEYSVKYYSPAYYDDELSINTTITNIKGARIYFTYEITNEKGEIICKASTTLVFVDRKTKRPIQAPQAFLLLIEKYSI